MSCCGITIKHGHGVFIVRVGQIGWFVDLVDALSFWVYHVKNEQFCISTIGFKILFSNQKFRMQLACAYPRSIYWKSWVFEFQSSNN